ncbi:hypothetical protein AB0323_00275 [Arthrobacter sp. NPDC080031]|uniref:hypothetical protein n=1 Tax=Arthrobacter sp. NPDC080031 TaxID=3155918 RepID=UPI00344F51D0
MSPYDNCVEVRKEMTQPDPQAQISQIQPMVAAGTNSSLNTVHKSPELLVVGRWGAYR